MADDNDPALKGFNETAFMAKHVAGKTIKSTVIGAAIGGGALAALAVGFGALTPVGWVAAAATYIGGVMGIGSGVLGTLGTIAAGGAIVGGVTGTAVGAATGISGAEEAKDAKKEELIAQAERSEMRVQKREAIEMQRASMHAADEAQKVAMHVSSPHVPTKAMDGISLT